MRIHWLWFVVLTVVCWGAYIPMIHSGQSAFITPESPAKGPLRAFMFVGVAYFLLAIIVPGAVVFGLKQEPAVFPARAMGWSTLAGVLGAIGAIGVILALTSGGKPYTVPPLVFAGAPVMSVIVGMMLHPPKSMPAWPFYAGIVLAAAGVSLILRFKPA